MASIDSILYFPNICRLCLSHDRPLSNIFLDYCGMNHNASTSLALKILDCVQINVCVGDNLPDKICKECIIQLENWIKFKDLCDNSNSLLIQYSAGLSIPSLPDEIFQNNLSEENKESPVDIPDTCSVDVSFLERDSLLQDLDDLRQDELQSPGLFLCDPLSPLLNEACIKLVGEEESLIDEKSEQEDKRRRWREKYSKLNRKKYECGVCTAVFTKFSNLLQHDKTDHANIIFDQTCVVCSKTFVSQQRLNIHLIVQHQEKTHECEVCGFKSVSEKSLRYHKLRHTERFACNVCGATKTSRSSLEDHTKVHSEEKTFACKHCNRTFKHQRTLLSHLKLNHTGLKTNEECDICSQSFKTYEYLKKHKETHKEENFICDVCGSLYKNKTTLRVHKLTHQEKKHICELCNKSFSTKHLLTRHEVKHVNSSIFTCKICDKQFNRADTLALHMNTHCPSQQVTCDQCGQCFSLNRYLRRHIVRVHNKEI